MKYLLFVFILATVLYLPSCKNNSDQSATNKNSKREWTLAEKEILKEGFMSSSVFMQSLQKDTSEMVARCFIDKYVSKFTMAEIEAQGSMTMKELSDLTMPMLFQCLEMFGINKRELEEG